MKQIKILALGPQEVIPPVDGGKESIHGALASLGEQFDVTYAYPRAENSAEAAAGYAAIGVRQVAVPFRPVESLGVILGATLQGRPYKFEKYSTTAAARAFADAVGPIRPDALICFHPHTVGLAEKIRRAAGWRVPILLREHNVEYELVRSYRDSLRGPLRLAASLFASFTQREEMRIWTRVDAVAFITDQDLAIARRQDGHSNLFLAPEGIPLPPRRDLSESAASSQLLVLLNPRATQSVDSLKRFLHTVWAQAAQHPRLQPLTLAITGVQLEQLAGLVDIKPETLTGLRVKALGFVPSLTAVFASSLALISPTYVGGGIRKKILEGMANQLPVITTRLDVESCGYFQAGRNLIAFESPVDFIDGAGRLREDKAYWASISEAGRSTVETHAHWRLFADRIRAEILRLVGNETGRPGRD
ncbi:glycosyltransferase [Cupriavidus sp. CP313]